MATTRRRHRYRSTVYLVLGILVLLTPVVLTHINNVEQQRIAEQYSQHALRLSEQERSALLNEARQYNQDLGEHPVTDPWGGVPDRNSTEYQRYEDLLASDAMMARVRIPSVGIDAPVYHGTNQSTLAMGVGHVYGTALPVGGEGTHSVLAGHTGLATVTMFDNISHVKDGDIMIVEVAGETLAYRVDQIKTVLPNQLEDVMSEAGHDRITLVTCTPYGINTHRLLIRGERTELPADALTQHYFSPWQPWMIFAVVVALIALIILLMRARKRRQQKRTTHIERTASA